MTLSPSADTLSSEQKAFWDDNGYLILKGALGGEEIAEVRRMVDRQWEDRADNHHIVDVLSGQDDGQNFRMHAARLEHRDEVHKLNNLFYTHPELRRIALNDRISSALTAILEGAPLICNSLNFERGSQQPFHLDTWYMPPPQEDRMVAANIALEPMDADNGPFIYYPGSHKIPYFRFSNGLLNAVDAELPACSAYMAQEIEQRGLKAQTFSCEAGDVFLWHARLFHGGAAIRDMNRTRRSLVVHYWRKQDMDASRVLTDPSGAYLNGTLRGEFAA